MHATQRKILSFFLKPFAPCMFVFFGTGLLTMHFLHTFTVQVRRMVERELQKRPFTDGFKGYFFIVTMKYLWHIKIH